MKNEEFILFLMKNSREVLPLSTLRKNEVFLLGKRWGTWGTWIKKINFEKTLGHLGHLEGRAETGMKSWFHKAGRGADDI